MPDQFSYFPKTPYSPGTKAVAVVPDNTAEITDTPKALYVGSGGDIVMRGIDSTADVTWKNVQAGSFLPFRPRFIRATGTTATDILAIY